jgi:Mg2+ and Co2+ transporter CorA
MNVGGIPFQQHPQGFMLVLGVLAGLTGILAYILFSRRRD